MLNLWPLELLPVTLKISPSMLLIPCHADMIELTYHIEIMKICHLSASASSYALMPNMCLFLKIVILYFFILVSAQSYRKLQNSAAITKHCIISV